MRRVTQCLLGGFSVLLILIGSVGAPAVGAQEPEGVPRLLSYRWDVGSVVVCEAEMGSDDWVEATVVMEFDRPVLPDMIDFRSDPNDVKAIYASWEEGVAPSNVVEYTYFFSLPVRGSGPWGEWSLEGVRDRDGVDVEMPQDRPVLSVLPCVETPESDENVGSVTADAGAGTEPAGGLAYTGAETGIVALLGVSLLLAGFGFLDAASWPRRR